MTKGDPARSGLSCSERPLAQAFRIRFALLDVAAHRQEQLMLAELLIGLLLAPVLLAVGIIIDRREKRRERWRLERMREW
jgi:hypothetical protein